MLNQYPDVLTVKEVAGILRLSPRAVYGYIERGAIPSFRLKSETGKPIRRVFVPKQALIDYMAATDEQH